ncbi:MAG: ComEA family DNA-binding protein [Pseudomonadales bacterium]
MKSILPHMALCLSLSIIWSPFSLANQTTKHNSDQNSEVGSKVGSEKNTDQITQESTEQIQIIEKVPIILYINTASAEEIAQALPGIGTIKAQAIVALREQLGGFTNIDQLLEVKGIGFNTLERISELIVIE